MVRREIFLNALDMSEPALAQEGKHIKDPSEGVHGDEEGFVGCADITDEDDVGLVSLVCRGH